MDERLEILPDPRFADWQCALDERLAAASRTIVAANFAAFLDPVMQETLRGGLRRAGTDEGTVWLIDEARENLAACFNSGPRAGEIVGVFRQPLRTGMISLVVASGQPLCENHVTQNARQDRTLDQKLGLVTCAMLAVPFYFSGQLRGVISGVRLKAAESTAPDPPGFLPEDLGALHLAATLLTRLIDYRLLTLTLGRETHD